MVRVPVTRVQRIRIVSEPPGATVAIAEDPTSGSLTEKEQGTVARGSAPVVIEQRYTAYLKRFSPWRWTWTAVFAVAVAVPLSLLAAGELSEDKAAGIATLPALGLLSSGLANLVLEFEQGKVARTDPAELAISLQLPGQKAREHRFALLRVVAPGGRPSAEPVVQLELAARPAGSRPPPVRIPRGTRLAVFDVDDQTGQLTAEARGQLTAELTARLAGRGIEVLAGEQLRGLAARTGAPQKCFPGTCQLAVAREAAAGEVLATRLQRLGQVCAVRSTLYSVSGGWVLRETSVPADCTPESLRQAAAKLAAELVDPAEPAAAGGP